jgi:hypothetical protein
MIDECEPVWVATTWRGYYAEVAKSIKKNYYLEDMGWK